MRDDISLEVNLRLVLGIIYFLFPACLCLLLLLQQQFPLPQKRAGLLFHRIYFVLLLHANLFQGLQLFVSLCNLYIILLRLSLELTYQPQLLLQLRSYHLNLLLVLVKLPLNFENRLFDLFLLLLLIGNFLLDLLILLQLFVALEKRIMERAA